MACPEYVGVKNITMTFTNCDTGERRGPMAHDIADDTNPEIKECSYTTEAMSGGRVKKTKSNARINVTVIPERGIPLAWYQGCASIDIQIEYYDGRIVTGIGGAVETGDSDTSNFESVAVNMVFKEIDIFVDTQVNQAA